MASGGSGIDASSVHDLKKTVFNNYLTCSICFDTFVNPHQLKCQHTFCLKCIYTLIKERGCQRDFPCPLCREKNPIKNGNPETSKNMLIGDILDMFSNLKDETEYSVDDLPVAMGCHCQLCEQEDHTPSCYCLKCHFWLCRTCQIGHKKMISTKLHPLLTTVEFSALLVNKLAEKMNMVKSWCEVIETDIVKLDFARYQTKETTDRIKVEINSLSNRYIENIRKQQAHLLKELETKSKDITAEIDKKAHHLGTLQNNLEDLKTDLDVVPDNILQKTEQDLASLDEIFNIVSEDWKETMATRNDRDIGVVSTIEFKPKDEYCDEANIELGILLQHTQENPVLLNPEIGGVINIVGNLEINVIRSVAFIQDHFFISIGKSLLYMAQNYNIINTIPYDASSYDTPIFWGVAAWDFYPGKVLVTVMGSKLGSGQICVCEKISFNQYRITTPIVKGLVSPRGIAVSNNGEFYICDQYEACVYSFTCTGQLQQIIKKGLDGAALFVHPMFVTVNHVNGDIVVSDDQTFIKILNVEGDLKTEYRSNKSGSEFWDLTTDHNGNILVVDWNHGVHILNQSGTLQYTRFEKPFGGTKCPVSIVKHPQHNSFLIGTSSGDLIYMS